MSSTQRLAVWRGDRLKTSGGLFKKDLVKNKRGKIVSKKKSGQARNQNNLGDFLKAQGAKMKKAEMLSPAGEASKKRAAAREAAPAKPRAAPAKPRIAPPPKPKPKVVPKVKKKKALPKGYNPLTRQPYEKKSGLGFVEGGKVNLDNVTTVAKPLKRRRRGRGNIMTIKEIIEERRRAKAEGRKAFI